MAYNFVAASNRYLSLPSTTATFNYVHQTAVFTIAFWAKLTSATANAFYAFFGNNGTTDAQTGCSAFWDNRSSVSRTKQIASNVTRSVPSSTVVATLSGTNAIDNTDWRSVIFVADGSTCKTYVDNVEVATGNVGTLATGNATRDMFIGAVNSATPPLGPFNGDLAEWAIWDVALNADERESLTKGFSPKRIRPASLQMYIPLIRNLQSIDTTQTVTNNNSATASTHPRVYA